MSCIESYKVYSISLGELVSYPIRFPLFDLSDPNVTLSGKLIDPDNVLVDEITFEILDQEVNVGVALMTFDSTGWSNNLAGLTLRFDVVLTVNNLIQPITVHTSPVMYLEVGISPTLSTPSI